jgi:hypothetical protein
VGPNEISDQPDTTGQITYPHQHLEKDSPTNREARNTMEVTYHDIEAIKVKSEDRDFYKVTYVTATDASGQEFTIRLFGIDNNQMKVEVE